MYFQPFKRTMHRWSLNTFFDDNSDFYWDKCAILGTKTPVLTGMPTLTTSSFKAVLQVEDASTFQLKLSAVVSLQPPSHFNSPNRKMN